MTDDRQRLRPSPSVNPDGTPDGGEPPRTTDQLRSEIDSGRTRDKVAFPDPAAAPLGTDSEAGGAPVPPGTLAAERERAGEPTERPSTGVPPQAQRPWMIWLIVAAAVAAGIAVLFAE